MHSKHSKLAPTLRRLLNPALVAVLVAPGAVLAGPTGDEVVRGSATIERPETNGTVINQLTDRAVVNWQSFSVGGQEYVLFNQPSASSVILNRVIGNDASTILGTVQSNGRVFLVNPNGIFFGESATLDVNGLVASTLDINDDDFMDGRFVLRRDENGADGAVQNAGTITTADGGFVVLAGDYVENTGVIAARLGHVVMASGAEVTLDLDGSGLIGFAVNDATLAELAGVRNAGEILAAGGMVIMTAEVARDLLSTVVNNEGLIAAHSVEDRAGVIYLHGEGGNVEHSGALLADGLGDGESGGDIRLIASETLTLHADSSISAQGATQGGFVEVSGHADLNLGGDITIGNGGTLLIDPNTLTIVPGGGGPGGTFTDSEVGVGFIAFQLDNNTDVRLIATQLITADPAVTALNATSGNGNLFINIGVPSGASAGNCGDFGFCAAGDTAFSVATGGSGGDILLGNMDVNILGEFSAFSDPDWTLSGDFAIGNVTAAAIQIDINGSLNAGNLMATVFNIDLVAGSVDQQVNIQVGNLTAANDSVGVYLWSDNPNPGTDSLNVGTVIASDEIYIASDTTFLRNFNFMVPSASAEYVYLNPELYGGGTLNANVGSVTAVYSEIDARVYGPSGGGTLIISGAVNVSDELYIWGFGDMPVNVSIANHISGANILEIESNGDLDALNVTAMFEADITATGDVTVGDVFAEFGIWLTSHEGSVTAANITLTNPDPGEEGSIYITADTGIDLGGITANSAGGAGIEINNYTSGDISILGGITSQASQSEGSVSLFQWGAGDISVGGLIMTNYLQVFHDVAGFDATLAGINMTPTGDGTQAYMNLNLSGSLTLGTLSWFADDGYEADVYLSAETLTVNGSISIVADDYVNLTLDATDLVLGSGMTTNLVSTSGEPTNVTLYGESMVINGSVTANTIVAEIWDPTYAGTVGQTYTISGTGSLNAINPGGDATLHLGIWSGSDIQTPIISLGLGSITVNSDTAQVSFDFGDGLMSDFTLAGDLTLNQTISPPNFILQTSGPISIGGDITISGGLYLDSDSEIDIGGNVTAAEIYLTANGSLTAGDLLANNANIYLTAGTIDQQVDVVIGDISAPAGLVNLWMWSDNPAAGTDSVTVGAVTAGDYIQVEASLSFQRNLNITVTSLDAPDVYYYGYLDDGGMLDMSVGDITAVNAQIEGMAWGSVGGGTLHLTGNVAVTGVLDVNADADLPVDVDIANHITGPDYIFIDAGGTLSTLNLAANNNVNAYGVGDVTVGDLSARFYVGLVSEEGSVTAANLSLIYHYGSIGGTVWVNSETGMNIGSIFADSDPGVSVQISNDGTGDIFFLGGITSQSSLSGGSVSLFQFGAGDISVGGLIKTDDLQVLHFGPLGFVTDLAGLELAPASDGTPPNLYLSITGDLTLGSLSFVDTTPGYGADIYLEATDTLTVLGPVLIQADGDVFLSLVGADLVLGASASVNLVNTAGGPTEVSLFGESMVINGSVTAQNILVEFWDPSFDGTIGQTYTISGTGSLNAINPGGDAVLHLGIWSGSDIQTPMISLGLGNIVVQGETAQLTFDYGTGTATGFNLFGTFTMAQTGTDPLATVLELGAANINIAANGALDLSNSVLDASGIVQLVSNSGDLHISGASIEAGTLVMQAAGDILNATPANLSADAMLLEALGNIDLGASTLVIGDGTMSGVTGDPDAIAVLTDYDLADTSTMPNGTLRAGGTIAIDTLVFDGGYLVFQGSGFTLGSFTGPTFQYVVQVAPISSGSDLLLTNAGAGTASASWEDFLSLFTGATYILGASDFGGVIDTGRATELDMGTANVLFASTIDPPLLGEVITSGLILTMAGAVGTVEERPFRPPTTAEIMGSDFRADAGVRTVTRFGLATGTGNDDPDRDDTIRHGSDDDLVCE